MSPVIKKEVVRSTSNPFLIEFSNGSSIVGFTTGAASGSGGASIRGQRADGIYMDEVDYMSEADFDTVTAIAAERSDIRIFLSSTPTGRRSKFYLACTDPDMGYSEHYHPSTHNPNWSKEMEAEFRAQLSEQGYIHEVMAEFGTQETGVFDKDQLDKSVQVDVYAYEKLNYFQKNRVKEAGLDVEILDYDIDNPAPRNIFRCVGVDFDKYQASSSIIVLDYDLKRKMFKVIKRIEVPRSEYSYDNALNKILEVNHIYNPSWIYCDRGSSEYIIERLHIIGEERPETGLKNKVKGFQFGQSLDITNPVTGEVTREPFKPFMVSQLQISFERGKMILSDFDEVLFKQLIDYEVVRVSQRGPVFTDKDDHYVDALGLAHLAFVLEFSDIINTVKDFKQKNIIENSGVRMGERALRDDNDEKPKARSSSDPIGQNYIGAVGRDDFGWGRRRLASQRSFQRTLW